MDANMLTEMRDYYDNTDQSTALESAELDTCIVKDPMIGITVRLPASILNAARALAEQHGVKVTALIRQWVELEIAEQVDDQRVIAVAELRRLIARAS